MRSVSSSEVNDYHVDDDDYHNMRLMCGGLLNKN